MSADTRSGGTGDVDPPPAEAEDLRARLREMQDLLARYQEHALAAETALAAFEGGGDGGTAVPAGRAIEDNATLRILELLVSSRTMELARGGLSAIETPWREVFLRNPFATSRWVPLRRAQRRLRKRPELRKRLAQDGG